LWDFYNVTEKWTPLGNASEGRYGARDDGPTALGGPIWLKQPKTGFYASKRANRKPAHALAGGTRYLDMRYSTSDLREIGTKKNPLTGRGRVDGGLGCARHWRADQA